MDEESLVPDAKKSKVTVNTFKKWKTEMDKEHQTVKWLECDFEMVGTKRIVNKLRCVVCAKYKEWICCRRNYSDRWVVGAESVRNSNIRDHAVSDQHIHAMNLLKREQGKVPSCSHAPIAQMLSAIPQLEKEQIKLKFDIAYFLAKKLSFAKFPKLCELEARHGVSIGNAYTNDITCSTFTHYIAESQRQQVKETILQAKFFSLLMDGSTDKGNVDDEMFIVELTLTRKPCLLVLKQLVDEQPVQVGTKGSYVWFRPKIVFLTSNVGPANLYKDEYASDKPRWPSGST
ncbi:hypothetical protein EMCRGX_G005677 [Ephydatia muelleri]